MLSKYRDRLSQHKKLLRRHLERAAFLHCAAGRPEAGRTYLLEAIAIDPDCAELHEHLQRSQQDPIGHAAELIEHAFRRVDGVNLYY